MKKVRVSQYQKAEPDDFNAIGQYCQDGLNELVVYMLGGAGKVITGGEVTAGTEALSVVVAPLAAIAPTGTDDAGALIISRSSQTVYLPGNATAGALVYTIQVGYREISGSYENRAFVNPVNDSEYAALTATETVPSPRITYKLGATPDAGYIALAWVEVDGGNTGSVFTASEITDKRRFRMDGLTDVYRMRPSTADVASASPPETSGGGVVFAQIEMAAGVIDQLIDSAIDWADRFVYVRAWYNRGGVNLMPGEANDVDLQVGMCINNTVVNNAPYVLDPNDGAGAPVAGTKYAELMYYSGDSAEFHGICREYNGAAYVDQWTLNVVSSELLFSELTGGSDVDVVAMITYSPKWRRY